MLLLVIWILVNLFIVVSQVANPNTPGTFTSGNTIIEAESWILLYGIIPRIPIGLRGIFTCPFIHIGWVHFGVNAGAIAIMGTGMAMRGLTSVICFTLWVMLLGGFMVWSLARFASHVGASGILFGYLVILVVTPLIERPFKLKSFLISLVIGLIYGSTIIGIFPSNPFISWEGHLFGAISGLLAALLWFFLWKRIIKPKWDEKRQSNKIQNHVVFAPATDLSLNPQQIVVEAPEAENQAPAVEIEMKSFSSSSSSLSPPLSSRID
jgi:membrane associated rhomboid family serine protease